MIMQAVKKINGSQGPLKLESQWFLELFKLMQEIKLILFPLFVEYSKKHDLSFVFGLFYSLCSLQLVTNTWTFHYKPIYN